ncbi:hypothetical protein GCM10027160_17350 [Streptomyces calidiresistens]
MVTEAGQFVGAGQTAWAGPEYDDPAAVRCVRGAGHGALLRSADNVDTPSPRAGRRCGGAIQLRRAAGSRAAARRGADVQVGGERGEGDGARPFAHAVERIRVAALSVKDTLTRITKLGEVHRK